MNFWPTGVLSRRGGSSEAFRSAANRLREFPHLGHVGDEPGTREWVTRGLPYVIVYRIDAQAGEVTVLGVSMVHRTVECLWKVSLNNCALR